mgnify:FL=1
MRETQRLDKIIANLGYGTRKEVKLLIKNDAIKVNGIVAKDGAMHVDPLNDVIEVGGQVLNYRKFIYLMMNKPHGVISATYDNRHKTVVDILPEEYKSFGLFPVGRLDADTEGLLIMTNDGQLAHELLSPKKHVPKRYYALVAGKVTEEDVLKFREGVVLDDGYKTMPAHLDILVSDDFSEIELVIYEGKFHQVKRMFEVVGKKVKYLRRIAMGSLALDENLQAGECRELTEDEVNMLKEMH